MTPGAGAPPRTAPEPSRRRSRKVTAVLGALLVGGGAGLLMSRWTTDRDGADRVAAVRLDQPLAVVQDRVAPMGPGVDAQVLSGSFTNDNPDPVSVHSVSVDITDVVEANGVEGECAASDYLLEERVMEVDALIPPGAERGTWSGATIQFDTTSENQDACKGATVVLAYAVETRPSE